ncbi:MAG: hypothetical protein P4L59_20145 [Desulfosporosinus sp.]|nr:hypothetical protein [Desulfosporosinus sp.]
MKKLVVYILTLFFLLSLTACSAKVPNNAGNVSSTAQTNVTYTKEFSYLPTYSKMELQNVAQPDKNQMINAKYIMKNTTTDIVLNKYADTFMKDGWTVKKTLSQDKKSYSLHAQKGNHIATLLPQQSGNDVILIIASK